MARKNEDENRLDTLEHIGELVHASRRQVLKGAGAAAAVALTPGLIGAASA